MHRISLQIQIFARRFHPLIAIWNLHPINPPLPVTFSTFDPLRSDRNEIYRLFYDFCRPHPILRAEKTYPYNSYTILCYTVRRGIGRPFEISRSHRCRSCMGRTANKRSGSTTLKNAFFRHYTLNCGHWGWYLAVGGRGKRRPGRGAIDQNWNRNLECTSGSLPIVYIRKIVKSRKKNSVFRSNVALNFRCRPFFLHFWKALGRPRRPIPTLGVQNVKDRGAGSDQKSILSKFWRFLTDPTRVKMPRKHSLTILTLLRPTWLNAQLDGLSTYVGRNSVRLVGLGTANQSLVTAMLKNTFFDFLAQNSATAGGIWRAGV